MAAVFVLVSCLGWLGPTSAAPFEPQTDFSEAILSLDTLAETSTEENHVSGELDAGYRRRPDEEMKLRRDLIRQQILDMLDLPCMPRPPALVSSQQRSQMARLLDLVQNSTTVDGPDVLKRALSLHPSCDTSDEEQDADWRPVPSLRVYFNLTSLLPTTPQLVAVEAAELRFFKGAQTMAALQTAGATLTPSEPATVRVSVYVHVYEARMETGGTYNGTLRVDAVTVPLSDELWVRLDVRRAVRLWQAGQPNTGFYLLVQDAAGRRLDPALFFEGLSCDSTKPKSPIPGFLLTAAHEHTLLGSPEEHYPLLDLQTARPTDSWPQLGELAATSAVDQPCEPSADRPADAPLSASQPRTSS